jgi:hypothetical protein
VAQTSVCALFWRHARGATTGQPFAYLQFPACAF